MKNKEASLTINERIKIDLICFSKENAIFTISE